MKANVTFAALCSLHTIILSKTLLQAICCTLTAFLRSSQLPTAAAIITPVLRSVVPDAWMHAHPAFDITYTTCHVILQHAIIVI